MSWKGYITNSGLSLVANWGERAVINFVRSEGGTGTYTEEEVRNKTSLVTVKQNISIIAEKKDGAKYSVKVEARAADVAYKLNQIGLYASLGNDEAVLFAIFQNEDGVDILSKVDYPMFVYSFYGTVNFANNGELTVTVDNEAYVTLGTLKEYLAQTVRHKDINGYYLNQKLASNTLYHVTGANDYSAPFNEAIVFGSCKSETYADNYENEETGSFPQFAFATNGNIYIRTHNISVKSKLVESFTDWKAISTDGGLIKEEVEALIAEHTHDDACYCEPRNIDLTKDVVIKTDNSEDLVVTENSVSFKEGKTVSFTIQIDLYGYYEFTLTGRAYGATQIGIKNKGDSNYKTTFLDGENPEYTFSGYAESIYVTSLYAEVSFPKFTFAEKKSTSGFASPEMLKRLITLEENVEAVGDAFDEIHAYAQALIGGDEE